MNKQDKLNIKAVIKRYKLTFLKIYMSAENEPTYKIFCNGTPIMIIDKPDLLYDMANLNNIIQAYKSIVP
jgi:hypothetical protein